MNFVQAMTDWRKERDSFVNTNLDKSKIAPRKTLFVTIPEIYEQEIKDFIKSKREQADDDFMNKSDLRHTELSIKFEEANPPPQRKDYE